LIDVVIDLGIEAIPVEYKTEDFIHLIYMNHRKINSSREIRERQIASVLSPERLRQLMMDVTDDPVEADRTVANYILESTRGK